MLLNKTFFNKVNNSVLLLITAKSDCSEVKSNKSRKKLQKIIDKQTK